MSCDLFSFRVGSWNLFFSANTIRNLIEDYKELSILVAGGWALLLIEKGKLDITKVRNIINRIIPYLCECQ